MRSVAAAAVAVIVLGAGLAACTTRSGSPHPNRSRSLSAAPAANAVAAAAKIKHVVIIMQENRSFDSYFGTFPGADGIPMSGGRPTACVPAPNGCQRPYHN